MEHHLPKKSVKHAVYPKVSRRTYAEPEHHRPTPMDNPFALFLLPYKLRACKKQFQLYTHGETQKLRSCSRFIKASAKHQQQTSRFTRAENWRTRFSTIPWDDSPQAWGHVVLFGGSKEIKHSRYEHVCTNIDKYMFPNTLQVSRIQNAVLLHTCLTNIHRMSCKNNL